jgi:hypothetical protein
VAQCAAALRVLLTPTAPQPYPCTSDQFTHDHHYPHGDEGERGDV